MVSNTPYSIISYEGDFNDDVSDYLTGRMTSTQGYDYNMVSILGSQSSGKSTLLNALFGTEFETMDCLIGRSQTTKGLWLSVDDKLQYEEVPMIVMDVEGTDSKERGEDRASFEHRASLFALALSDLVMINMWYTDLGRYTASQYGLLKTILQVNLELFGRSRQGQDKTVLVFIIRDYSPSLTPMDKLEALLNNDVLQIWSQIEKPPDLENSRASDFFDLKFVGLSSFMLNKEAFMEDTMKLRTSLRTDWLKKENSKKIPIDGQATYMKSIWNAIINNSDLDIPSQKVMLSTFRCEELKSEALRCLRNTLDEESLKTEELLISHEVEIVKTNLSSWLLKVISNYDAEGYRYDTRIFLDMRKDLIVRLTERLQSHFTNLLTPLIRELVTTKQSKLKSTIQSLCSESKDNLPDTTLVLQIDELLKKWLEETESIINLKYGSLSSRIPPILESLGPRKDQMRKRHPDWEESDTWNLNVSTFVREVIEKQELQAQQEFEQVSRRFMNDLNTALEVEIWPKSGVDEVLVDVSLVDAKFWERLNSCMSEVSEQFIGKFSPALIALNGSAFKSSDIMSDFTAFLAISLKSYIKSLATSNDRLARIITDRFDMNFYDDGEGVPRNWIQVTYEEIGEIYKGSRDDALKVLSDLSGASNLEVDESSLVLIEARLKDEGVQEPWTTPLIGMNVKGSITDRTTRHMKRAVTDAQAINSSGHHGSMPSWHYWLAVMVLGYNEFVAILYSPIMMSVFLVIALLVSVAYLSPHHGNYLRSLFSMCCASFIMPMMHNITTGAFGPQQRGDTRPKND